MAAGSSGAGKTVLVLGGGVGGVVTANGLRRRLEKRHRVILVNRDPLFSFAASYLWVMTGKRNASQVTRPLQRLQRRGIEVVIGDVEAIDPTSSTATVSGRIIEADYLVVTLGADYATAAIPGLADTGHTFATLPGARQLGIEIDRIDSGRVLVVTGAPVYRCPAAPYETALLIDAHLRKRGVRDNVEIAVRSAEPMPMGVAGVNVADAVKAILADRGIDYRGGDQITSAADGQALFADGDNQPFDLLAYMPPITSPAVVAQSELVGVGGWIEADRNTLTTNFEGVYAIGDNVAIPLSIGKPLPRAGVFAHAEAKVVAANIAATINGKAPTARFDGHGGCFIEVGDGRAGYGSGNFFAEPSPNVKVRQPDRQHHLGKILFEKDVLWRWLR
jgi:sulfide:quinone oxidoreductase